MPNKIYIPYILRTLTFLNEMNVNLKRWMIFILLLKPETLYYDLWVLIVQLILLIF